MTKHWLARQLRAAMHEKPGDPWLCAVGAIEAIIKEYNYHDGEAGIFPIMEEVKELCKEISNDPG